MSKRQAPKRGCISTLLAVVAWPVTAAWNKKLTLGHVKTNVLTILLALLLLCCGFQITITAVGNGLRSAGILPTLTPTSTRAPTSTPLPTRTPLPTATLRPTRTPKPTATQRPTATPTRYLTPRPTATTITRSAITPLPAATTGPVCECSYNAYNCDDFITHRAAVECFEYCNSIGAGDIHALDGDGDGRVCEDLP